ncbi:natural resistance-associated macrophage protein 2 [Trichonephila inaurata madagascariensis]|uniref:Natural resistance-associated macrophage protein 2 n=1 Tax=Trichonephila inaurata madagascariensis TaxID=2747483 RepID=A0A8X6IL26_9ARAC|nr:natural resistance-associated macrophage protein 2 [Trichonephila inaurata madagascariensis]
MTTWEDGCTLKFRSKSNFLLACLELSLLLCVFIALKINTPLLAMDNPDPPSPALKRSEKVQNGDQISQDKATEKTTLKKELDTYFQERITIPETDDYRFNFKKLWAFTGPGFLMSIAYLDPGNIESDLQSGAIASYHLLWVLMWATALGLLMQRLAARLGVVTGLHLAEVCQRRFPPVPRYLLWIMVEIAIVGSDMQENDNSTLEVDIYRAGVFLGCEYGNIPLYIWAIGILAAGQSSTMTGTYSGQFVMEGVFLGCEYGNIPLYIWAIGILAAGQSSTMTGTYSGQFVMEGFLNLKWARWKRVLLTRCIAIAPTLFITVYSDIQNLSKMNDYLNALMSLQLPFALFPTLIFTSSKGVMGDFQNGIVNKVIVTLLGITVIGINLYFVEQFSTENLPNHWAVYLALALYILFYVCFVFYLALCLMYVLGFQRVSSIPIIGTYVVEPYDLNAFSSESRTEMYKSTDIFEASGVNVQYKSTELH